jgi:hypothetical protein
MGIKISYPYKSIFQKVPICHFERSKIGSSDLNACPVIQGYDVFFHLLDTKHIDNIGFVDAEKTIGRKKMMGFRQRF